MGQRGALHMAVYENLSLEGGGTKGHIYMGAALEFEKLGVLQTLQSISGSNRANYLQPYLLNIRVNQLMQM